jgi:hypothetical protein
MHARARARQVGDESEREAAPLAAPSSYAQILALQASAGNQRTAALLARARLARDTYAIDPAGLAGPQLQARMTELRARLDALENESGFAERVAYWARSGAQVGLNQQQIALINWWVAGGWGTLNNYVRGNHAITQILFNGQIYHLTTVAQDLTAVLQLLPPFNRRTFRKNGFANANVWSNLIQPGDHVIAAGFFGTSALKGGGGGATATWGQRGNAWYEVTGLTGKDIAPYSTIGDEKEVLFDRGTIFQVDAIRLRTESDGTRTPFVIMHEVAAPPPGIVLKNIYDGTVAGPPPALPAVPVVVPVPPAVGPPPVPPPVPPPGPPVPVVAGPPPPG